MPEQIHHSLRKKPQSLLASTMGRSMGWFTMRWRGLVFAANFDTSRELINLVNFCSLEARADLNVEPQLKGQTSQELGSGEAGGAQVCHLKSGIFWRGNTGWSPNNKEALVKWEVGTPTVKHVVGVEEGALITMSHCLSLNYLFEVLHPQLQKSIFIFSWSNWPTECNTTQTVERMSLTIVSSFGREEQDHWHNNH